MGDITGGKETRHAREMGRTIPGDLGHRMTPVIDDPAPDVSQRIRHNTTPYIDNLGQDASARIAQNMTPPAPQTPPQPSLTIINLDSGGITFSDSFACGGWSRLTIRPDGSYTFSGHFHDSGALSYTTGLVWAVRSSQNRVFTFGHHGEVHGTFASGSRDDDWSVSGSNAEIAANWADLAAGYQWHWEAALQTDLGDLVSWAVKVYQTVASVIAVVF